MELFQIEITEYGETLMDKSSNLTFEYVTTLILKRLKMSMVPDSALSGQIWPQQSISSLLS